GRNGGGRSERSRTIAFWGLKDFILGAQFVDGLGRALRVGGKVVKNAAGFDLPKFFVGSLGRFGVLTELTLKVFPAPVATRTLKLVAPDIESATAILVEAARSRWEPHALDLLPGGFDVFIRLGGPGQAIARIAREILERYPGAELSDAAAQQIWSDLREFKWAHPGGMLTKIVSTPAELPRLSHALQSFDQCRVHASAGGSLAFVSLPADRPMELDAPLRNLSLSAMTLRGPGPLWLGAQPRREITNAVKLALDPEKRFPDLDD